MNLLIINSDDEIKEEFSENFEEIDLYPIENVKIDVHQGERFCKVNDTKITEYDSVYIKPNPKAITFSKVFLDSLTGKDVNTSIDGTSFYIISKKPYLFKVLQEKNVNIPLTYVVPSRKSAKGIEDDLGEKIVYTEYERYNKTDIKLIEDKKEVQTYTENLDSTDKYAILQEYIEGEVFSCLYIDGDIISTKITGDYWRLSPSEEYSERYHSLSNNLEEVVRNTADAIGANLFSVRIVGGYVTDVYANPDLKRFKKVSGKDTFGKVAKMLKGDNQ